MTSINSFFKLLAEELKRRLPEVIISLFIFIITLPILSILNIESMKDTLKNQSADSGISLLSIYQDNAGQLNINNFLVIMLVIIFGLFFALSGFSYLFSKKKVDFYHSIPIRREVCFFIKYICGIIIFIIPYFINVIFASLIYKVNTFSFSMVFSDMMAEYLINVAYFMLIYSIVVFAIMLTGNFIISIITAAGISVLVPIIKLVLYLNMEFFFTTYYGYAGSSNLLDKAVILSPISMIFQSLGTKYGINRLWYYMGISDYDDNTNSVLIFILLAVIILTLISLLLYKKRSMERSGKAFVFNFTERILKFVVSIPAAAFVGIIFLYFTHKYHWYLIGIIIGALVIPCVLEMIFHFDVKKAFSHKIEMCVIFVVSILAAFAFRYDWFGYDSYLPSKDKVESISISVGMDRGGNFYNIILDDGNVEYLGRVDYQLRNTAIKDTSITYPLINAAINDTKEHKGNKFNYDDYFKDGYKLINVKYNLKNGKEVYRNYFIENDEDNIVLINALLTSKEYYENAYSIYRIPEERIKEIYYVEDADGSKIGLNHEELITLLHTYQDEFGTLGINYPEENTVYGELLIYTSYDHETIKAGSIPYVNDTLNGILNILSEKYIVSVYPVYSSFTETIRILEYSGIEINKKSVDNVISITLNFRDYMHNDYGQVIYTDKESIERIMPHLSLWNYQYDYLSIPELPAEISSSIEQINVTVEYNFGDTSDGLENKIKAYYFTDIPEFVIKDINNMYTIE